MSSLIIRIDRDEKEKVFKLLEENNILHQDITHKAYFEHIIDDIDNAYEWLLDTREDEEYESAVNMSAKDFKRMVDQVSDDLMDYDYSDYNCYVEDQVLSWVLNYFNR